MPSQPQIIRCSPFDGSSPQLGDVVLAIGVFDGMHVGHRALFAQARQSARDLGIPLAVITFEQDPDEIFRAGDPSFGKLLSNERRLEMIAEQAEGPVLALPALARVFSMEPEEFLGYLGSVSHPKAIFTGANFRFGSRAKGTGTDVARWSEHHGCAYISCELVEQDGDVVSSTRIRSELAEGRVSQAKLLLAGRPHSIEGVVVHGRGEGAGFGFATANLDLSACEVMLPREGVYGCYGIIGGRRYPAAVNVGVARSFEGATAAVEAHLLDFEGDLYGEDIAIQFEQWLREPRIFDTQEELIETVTGNINWVRENL